MPKSLLLATSHCVSLLSEAHILLDKPKPSPLARRYYLVPGVSKQDGKHFSCLTLLFSFWKNYSRDTCCCNSPPLVAHQRERGHRSAGGRPPGSVPTGCFASSTPLPLPSEGPAGTTTLASVTILTPCVPSQSRVSLHSPLHPFTAPCLSHSPADPGPAPTQGSPYLRHRLLWQESAVPPQWLLLRGEYCFLTCSSVGLSSLK